MNPKKKILFIVNPNSGTKQVYNLKELIDQQLDSTLFDFEIEFTKEKKHATELSKNAVSKSLYAIVIVGGDGSVNEVATGLINSNTLLGVIPKGSGNGLARHLGIPLEIKDAIKVLNKLNYEKLDSIKINNKYSFNVSGVGFEAHIAHLFEQSKNRGLLAYSKLCLKEYFSYKEQEYIFTLNGKSQKISALSIAIANSSQFGNNIEIAPEAKTNDGIINITVIKPFKRFNFISFLYYLLTRQIHKAPFVKTFRCKEFKITSDKNITSHIDGEAVNLGNEINGTIIANAIKVLT